MTDAERLPRLRASPAYTICLSLALVGLPFLATGLGGEFIAMAGGESAHGLDTFGLAMFFVAGVMSYAVRLLFWPPAPAKLRTFVRAATIVILVANFIASAIGLIYVLMVSHDAIPVIFCVLAILCQPFTILWLLRYRKEGL